jgi:hypothetical protein
METARNNIVPLIMRKEFITDYKKEILTYYEKGDYGKYLDFFATAYKKQNDYLSYFFKFSS